MRIAFLLLVIVHGLLHLLGVVKAFGLSEVTLLTQPISRPFGVMWLLAFLLFAVTAILLAVKNGSWWWVGCLAVVVSQVLIFYFWQDARFGTLANAIVLTAALIGYTTARFYGSYLAD